MSFDKTLIWDTSSGERVLRTQAAGQAMAFSGDGELFAATVNPELAGRNEKIEIWDVDTWTKVGELAPDDWTDALMFSPDGRRIFTGGYNGVLNIWDVKTSRRLPAFSGNPGRIWTMASTANGAILATGSARGVQIWSSSSGRALFRVSTVPAWFDDRIALSPDGSEVVAQSQNGTVTAYLLDLDKLLALARARGRPHPDRPGVPPVPASRRVSSGVG